MGARHWHPDRNCVRIDGDRFVYGDDELAGVKASRLLVVRQLTLFDQLLIWVHGCTRHVNFRIVCRMERCSHPACNYLPKLRVLHCFRYQCDRQRE